MGPQNIREFRAALAVELEAAGFIPKKLAPRLQPAWLLPRDEVVPYFHPGAHRHPKHFRLWGYTGIDIPSMRDWLRTAPSKVLGTANGIFLIRHMANDRVFDPFWVPIGEVPPWSEWIEQLKEILSAIPATVPALLDAHRCSPERLGGFGDRFHQESWQLLEKWWGERSSAGTSDKEG